MFKSNRNLLIIALVALVNMLGYGIIIPILYSYAKKFGLTDFQNGLLFASFSICQFISTPIIGRMSDKYGRRPLLIISITGTAISFLMMAFAPNFIFLFLARMLDGLTAGNIPVAFAVISDSTIPEDRGKAFGMVSAAFNFGFIFGPAISAITLGFGTGAPFLVAALVTIVAVVITALFLPETNKHIGEVKKEKIFDFAKMWHTLFEPNVGPTFVVSLLYFLAFSCSVIYGFQPFVTKVLGISAQTNSVLFTIFGICGLITQTFLVQFFSKKWGVKKAFTMSMLLVAFSFLLMFLARSLVVFGVAMAVLAVFNGIGQTLIPAILSKEADDKSQGSIMGLNASYQSIGMIVGPILGGIIASAVSIPATFSVGMVLVLVCYFLSFKMLRPGVHKESAFS